MSGIDCRQAETLVARYIKHTLSTDELEEFLDHIEHCSSCYDELETYFIVHEAIQQLDEKEDGTVLDFRELLAVVIAAASFVVFLVMDVTHFL